VKGSERVQFATNVIFNKSSSPQIIDLDKCGCPTFNSLFKDLRYDLPDCHYATHANGNRYKCSKKQAWAFKTWINMVNKLDDYDEVDSGDVESEYLRSATAFNTMRNTMIEDDDFIEFTTMNLEACVSD